ncbi:MAG TPA: TetR/AcrR family transcriptional regulator [Polyangiaceae bacterium]|nr:TetR/AcrR family transcriptional regulator [Polyangiaceae bacterium]
MARQSDPNARQKLLRAAQHVFARKGLDRSKVEDITQHAGLSKGAFYLHFKSKEAAFIELLSGMLEALGKIALDMDRCIAAREAGSLADFLDEWLNRDTELFEFVWQNRQLMRLTLEGGGSAHHLHLIDDFAQRAQEVSVELLRSGVAAGFYRKDLDVGTAAAFIAGGYDRFARQLVRETKKPNIRERIMHLQRIAVTGVGDAKLVQALQRRAVGGDGTSKPGPAKSSAAETVPQSVRRKTRKGRNTI